MIRSILLSAPCYERVLVLVSAILEKLCGRRTSNYFVLDDAPEFASDCGAVELTRCLKGLRHEMSSQLSIGAKKVQRLFERLDLGLIDNQSAVKADQELRQEAVTWSVS